MPKSHIEKMQDAVRDRLRAVQEREEAERQREEAERQREEAERQREQQREKTNQEVEELWENEKSKIFTRAIDEVNEVLQETVSGEGLRQVISDEREWRKALYEECEYANNRNEGDSILFCCMIIYESSDGFTVKYLFAVWYDGYIEVKRCDRYGDLEVPSRAYLAMSTRNIDLFTDDSASRLLAELVMDAQGELADEGF